MAQQAEMMTTFNVVLLVCVPAVLGWYGVVGVLASFLMVYNDIAGVVVTGLGLGFFGEVLWRLSRRSFLRWYPRVLASVA